MTSTHDSPPIHFVATCDLAGHLRGRSVPASARDKVMASGVGWVPANLAIDAFGHLVEPNEFGASGDLRLLPSETARLELAATEGIPGTVIHLADQTRLDGSAWECCPRTFLRSALAELESRAGLRIVAAFEHEFHLHDSPSRPPFSLAALRDAEPFGSALVNTLEANGFAPETWLAEYGDGQYEITVAPASGMTAADRAVLLRAAVRDLATRHGRRVTFSPVVEPEGIGNGVHVHLSLVDVTTGKPVLFDPARPGLLSEVGGRFAAGILAHGAALTAISAPSPVSYLRLGPHHWSTGGIFLGERNREAFVRVCPVDASRPDRAADGFHLEFRAADATANPHLVLGMLILAGLRGIEQEPPARVWSGDLSESDLATLPALPASLPDALAALEADATACKWFDPVLLRTYLSVKRSELAQVAELDADALCRRLSDVY
ncbi:glutamine synthetase family protein [Amycolatopsis sp. GM8]|uniref:glutamine synthetase family protein n=1 Tax=Amycolatopsis sp. GM8 TaxID=2896530 RepID=UPI001F268947|nr:glutamine synthetase family protein [Amycolatopsis sp. GM8]